MLATDPTRLHIPVTGGALRVARWGLGDRVVLAAHGLTASSISWQPIARRLDEDHTLLAPDLRGRGGSARLPGPYGLAQHADDVLAVADGLGITRAVLAGESMGAFVAVLAAARRPQLVERVVLVDGGLPLDLPLGGADPDTVVEATLGPALARLSQTFPSVEAYFDFWRAHPAVSSTWNEDVEDYLRYDLVGEAPNLRPAASEEVVRADARDILAAPAQIVDALRRIECPVVHLRAERGLMDEPPGLQPAELVASWGAEIADFTSVFVEDTNHYSIAFGERGAEAIVRAISGADPPRE